MPLNPGGTVKVNPGAAAGSTSDYSNYLSSIAPNDTVAQPMNLGVDDVPTPNQGGALLSASGEGLLNNQIARGSASGAGNDMAQLMAGVGANGSQGLLKDTPSASSLGGVGGDTASFEQALSQRGKDALGDTVQSINAQNQMNLPLRIAQRQATAAASLAKNEQLRFNNWTLKNTYDLQYAQLQSAQKAQEASLLSSILGIIPAAAKIIAGAH